jgi:hypothetical protein
MSQPPDYTYVTTTLERAIEKQVLDKRHTLLRFITLWMI